MLNEGVAALPFLCEVLQYNVPDFVRGGPVHTCTLPGEGCELSGGLVLLCEGWRLCQVMGVDTLPGEGCELYRAGGAM